MASLTAESVAGNVGVRVADDVSMIRVNRDELRAFNLVGLDLAARSAATTGDVTLIGRFEGGAVLELNLAFNSTTYTRFNVGWTNLEYLDIVSSGGVNGFAPLVDNLVVEPFA